MTVYCEDPHDSWHDSRYVKYLASIGMASGAKDHSGRGLFWMEVAAVLAVFWFAVAWGVYAIL